MLEGPLGKPSKQAASGVDDLPMKLRCQGIERHPREMLGQTVKLRLKCVCSLFTLM